MAASGRRVLRVAPRTCLTIGTRLSYFKPRNAAQAVASCVARAQNAQLGVSTRRYHIVRAIWAADSDSELDPSAESAFVTAATDESSARMLSTAAAAPLAAGLLGALAVGHVDHWRVALWIGFVVIASVSDTAVAGVYRWRRAHRQLSLVRWPRDQLVTNAMLGAAWALAPVLLNAGSSRRDMQLLIVVFLSACGATAVVMNTGPRRYFLVFQCPICISVAITQLLHIDPTSLMLAVGALFYLAVTAQLNEQVRLWSLNSIRLNADNTRLIGQLTHRSTHDPLTDLPNRAMFSERIDALDAASQPFALVYIDIDDFKKVNDRHGHAAGDDLLRWVAERMRQSIRDTDLLARSAGDEFTILLTPVEGRADAGLLAERIRHAIADADADADADGTLLPINRVSVSVGVAVSHAGASAEHILELADRSLYTAKRDGKNRVVIHEWTSATPPEAETRRAPVRRNPNRPIASRTDAPASLEHSRI
jgi:diguanylate cyclase (GGDEF)-like protein